MSVDRNHIENIDYWKSLNPQSSIHENPFGNIDNSDLYPVTDDLEALKTRLCIEGYFSTEPILPQTEVEKLKKIVLNVVKNHPERPNYALLYDDFYRTSVSLRSLLTSILGEQYLLVLDEPEAYYIPNSDSRGGSKKHRDSLHSHDTVGKDGMPQLVNVWIPLTDISTQDSCMYVVPAQHDQNYPKQGIPPAHPESLEFAPEDARAVPVRAGSVICWSTSLIHWGGTSSSFASGPRVSFAMYYQAANSVRFHKACFRLGQAIPFRTRLYLVEKAYNDPKGKRIRDFL